MSIVETQKKIAQVTNVGNNMVMKFRIEKNVAVPQRYSKTHSELMQLAFAMEIGDSIGGLSQTQANSISARLRKVGKRATTRKITKDHETEALYRLWYVGELENPGTSKATGSPVESVCVCDQTILTQAEDHEEDKNIVDDMDEIHKVIREENSRTQKLNKTKKESDNENL
mgnify:FL=1